MNHLTIGDRQHAALLAALQLWQRVALEHPELITEDILQTARGGDGEALDYDGVNALCRGINDGVNCLNNEFRDMVVAFDKLANHLDEVDEADLNPVIIEAHNGIATYLNGVTAAGLACGDLVPVDVPETVEQGAENL